MKKIFAQVYSKIENSAILNTLMQFVKFGIVGVSNTAISYGVEMLFFYVVFVNAAMSENAKVILASVIAFIISVTNSYIWNSRFVFKAENNGWRDHFISYLKTVASYGVTGLLLSPAIKMILVGWNMPYYFSSLVSLVITIPLNFLLNKFWAFRKNNADKISKE